MAPDPNSGTGSEHAEQTRTQPPGRRFRRPGRGRRGRGRRPRQAPGQPAAAADANTVQEQASAPETQEMLEQEAHDVREDVREFEAEAPESSVAEQEIHQAAEQEIQEAAYAEPREVRRKPEPEPIPPPPIERVALPEAVKQEFAEPAPKPVPTAKVATPEAIQKAIEDVTRVIETLRESLEDMEAVLETLELAERQKFADEQEIEQLRRALRHLHKGRDSGRDPGHGQRQSSHGSHGR